MSERNDDELVLDLDGGRRTRDGRTRLRVEGGAPLRLGSDANRANALVDGLAPLHATIAPVKGGGLGVRIEGGAPATLNEAPVAAARLALGDRLVLGDVALRVVAERPRRTPLPELPGYRLEKQLGRGAMGRVYLAVQESLARKVALKVLEPHLSSDAAFVAEFQSEARAAAALHHTNVVTVFDVGEHEGRHYLALEYMDRGSLEDRLAKEGALPWRAVLGILRDAVAGLEYAETKGLVHRDVKPANLMQNATGVTKIVDLGLAVAAAEAEAGGRIRGTAHFMAPEQARGEPLDSRADLYALGASAWRLLTARTPFTGSSPREILRAALTQPPPPLAPLVPGLPADVEQFVLALMAKERDQRPANARAARERIDALVQRHIAGQGHVSGDAAAPADGASARRWPLVAVGIVLAVGGVAAAVLLGGGDEPKEPEPVAGPSLPTPEAPPLEPTEVATPDVAPSVPDVEGDEDAALRELEAQAQSLLASALAQDEPEARRLRLVEVTERFPGTTAATLASEELERSGASATPSEAEAPRVDVDALRARELASLRERARGSDDWLPPQRALHVLDASVAPAALASDEGLAAGLLALRAEIEAAARARVERERGLAFDHVVEGRFEQARSALEALLAWLREAPPPPDVPVAPAAPVAPPAVEGTAPAPAPAPTVHLADAIAAVEADVAALPALEQRRERAMAHRDLRARHDALRAAQPATQALESFDLAAAASRIAALPTLSQDGAQWSQDQVRWLRDGAGFFALLRATFEGGQWRRRSIALPGQKREVREVVAIDDRGFVFGAQAGTDVVPLSAFAGATDLVQALVDARLVREWSPTERRTIAATLVATAVVEGLRRARPALDGGAVEAGAAEALTAALGRARGWLADEDSDLAAELAAVDALEVLLGALGSGDAGRAAFACDVLLEQHARTLLVTLLSDGTAAAAPPTWPPER